MHTGAVHSEIFSSLRRARFRLFPPVVLQGDENDCGAACLAMISNYYGQPLKMHFWRRRLELNPAGASVAEMIEVADSCGLAASAWVTEDLEAAIDGEEIHFPLVIVRQAHYLVVHGIRGTLARVSDPAIGGLVVPVESLRSENGFVGISFTPESRFFEIAAPKDERSDALFGDLLRGRGMRVSALLAIAGAGVLVTLLPPYATKILYDEAIPHHDLKRWAVASLLTLAATLTVRLQQWIDDRLVTVIRTEVEAEGERKLLGAILRIRFREFQMRSAGDYLQRLEEIEKMPGLAVDSIIPLIIDVVRLVFYVGAFFWVDTRVGLFVVIVTPFLCALPGFLQARLNGLYNISFQSRARFTTSVSEHLQNIRSVKTMNAIPHVEGKLRTAVAEAASNRKRYGIARGNFLHGSALVTDLVVSAFIALVSYLAIEGRITLGDVSFIVLLGLTLFTTASNLSTHLEGIGRIGVSLGRANDVFLAHPERKGGADFSGPMPILPGEPLLEFRDVWFRYGGESAPWILKGVSFQLRAGDRVAVLGRNGSGKSTIAYLMAGLVDPQRGEIFLGGRPLAEWSLQSVREAIGYVGQSAEMFSGTILENVRFASEEGSVASLNRALAMTGVAELLAQPRYELLRLRPGGFELSGGQRQRVALARVLARDPRALCLDEFSANLDGVTERSILEAMGEWASDRAVIQISHRREVVEACNRALWLEDGVIRSDGKAPVVLAEYELA